MARCSSSPSRSPVTLLLVVLLIASNGLRVCADSLQISDAQAMTAGKRLWHNECNGTIEGLTSWNSGEDFASLGIGHYIWYPASKRGPFEESFPDLVRFLERSNVPLPDWLHGANACPWNSREEFVQNRNGARMNELRGLLARTVAQQARFSANRLEAALPKMLAELPDGKRESVRQKFYRVAGSPNGFYALIDYVNFKGEGTLATERYHNRGWGLLQVLDSMRDEPSNGTGTDATREFSASAVRVLTERVSNAPPERHESRWLPGWKNRVETYASHG